MEFSPKLWFRWPRYRKTKEALTMEIFVTGATGVLGRTMVPLLLSAGSPALSMLKVLSPYYRLKRPTNMCQMATSSTVFRAFSAVLRGASPSSIESAREPVRRTSCARARALGEQRRALAATRRGAGRGRSRRRGGVARHPDWLRRGAPPRHEDPAIEHRSQGCELARERPVAARRDERAGGCGVGGGDTDRTLPERHAPLPR